MVLNKMLCFSVFKPSFAQFTKAILKVGKKSLWIISDSKKVLPSLLEITCSIDLKACFNGFSRKIMMMMCSAELS